MNKKMYKMILLGGLSLLVLAGCQKGLFDFKGGKEVVFTASSGVGTKAAYENAFDGKYQRIGWEVGDDIVIFSDKAETQEGQRSSVYLVKDGITATGAKSMAKLDNQGSGLRYKDDVDGPYQFAGAFPSTGLTLTENGASLNAIIPTKQTIVPETGFPSMKGAAAIMLADGVSVDKDASVSLNFRPVFTTFQLTFAAETEMTVTGITLRAENEINGVINEHSTMTGGFDSTINFNDAEPTWVPNVQGGYNYIQPDFDPIKLTLEEGATKTNEVTIGVYAVPADITGLTFIFFVQLEEGGTTEQRVLRVAYAKAVDGHSQGDPVYFKGGLKHNITGITIPGNMSKDVELQLAVVDWDDTTGTITYGTDGETITALALDYVSGAQVTDGSRRTRNNFANADNPIVGYFYAFAPTTANWKISISGNTDKFVVTSTEATSSSATELTGPVNGRVNFQIARKSDTASTDEIKLNFSLVFEDGREVSINSEVTRANALTITGKVGQ